MRILLATDGSKNAEEAAWFLAHLPHAEPLEVTILGVTPVFAVHGSKEVVEWIKRNTEQERERALEACKRIAGAFLGADVSIETVVVEGHAGTTIVAEARDRDTDLIVLGALGHSTIDRMLLGSVSDFVATHAPCSVMLVRPDRMREPQHEELKICLAYDGSKRSDAAIEDISNFKWGGRTHLDIVHAVQFPFIYSELPMDIDTGPLRAEMTAVVQQVAAGLQSLFPRIDTHVFEATHVGDALVRFVDEHKCNLVVMGDTGHGLVGRFLLGSVSRYLLRNANSSLWIARES